MMKEIIDKNWLEELEIDKLDNLVDYIYDIVSNNKSDGLPLISSEDKAIQKFCMSMGGTFQNHVGFSIILDGSDTLPKWLGQIKIQCFIGKEVSQILLFDGGFFPTFDEDSGTTLEEDGIHAVMALFGEFNLSNKYTIKHELIHAYDNYLMLTNPDGKYQLENTCAADIGFIPYEGIYSALTCDSIQFIELFQLPINNLTFPEIRANLFIDFNVLKNDYLHFYSESMRFLEITTHSLQPSLICKYFDEKITSKYLVSNIQYDYREKLKLLVNAISDKLKQSLEEMEAVKNHYQNYFIK